MIPREMLMQALGKMSDQELLQALAAAGGSGGMSAMSGDGKRPMDRFQDPALAALDYDQQRDGLKPWSQVKIPTGADERPALADKDYMVPKEHEVPNILRGGMPTDDGGDCYGAPGGR